MLDKGHEASVSPLSPISPKEHGSMTVGFYQFDLFNTHIAHLFFTQVVGTCRPSGVKSTHTQWRIQDFHKGDAEQVVWGTEVP